MLRSMFKKSRRWKSLKTNHEVDHVWRAADMAPHGLDVVKNQAAQVAQTLVTTSRMEIFGHVIQSWAIDAVCIYWINANY